MDTLTEFLLQTRNPKSWLSYLPDELIRKITQYIPLKNLVNSNNYDIWYQSITEINAKAVEICSDEMANNIGNEFAKHYRETKEETLTRSFDKRNWRWQKEIYSGWSLCSLDTELFSKGLKDGSYRHYSFFYFL